MTDSEISNNVSNNVQPGLATVSTDMSQLIIIIVVSYVQTVEELQSQLAELKNENEKLKLTESRLRKVALQDTLENSVIPTSAGDSKQNILNNMMLLVVLCIVSFLIGILIAKFTL